jgi:hypothetical protein
MLQVTTGFTQGSQVQTQLRRRSFKDDKNPQHTFLPLESKARGPMTSFYSMLMNLA